MSYSCLRSVSIKKRRYKRRLSLILFCFIKFRDSLMPRSLAFAWYYCQGRLNIPYKCAPKINVIITLINQRFYYASTCFQTAPVKPVHSGLNRPHISVTNQVLLSQIRGPHDVHTNFCWSQLHPGDDLCHLRCLKRNLNNNSALKTDSLVPSTSQGNTIIALVKHQVFHNNFRLSKKSQETGAERFVGKYSNISFDIKSRTKE